MNKINKQEMINERRSKCASCVAYKPQTNSCGTFMNPLNDIMEVDGVKFRPCGCNINLKSSMSFADCPANRWEKRHDSSFMQKIKDIVAKARGTNIVTFEERKELSQAMYSMTGRKHELKNCVGCVTQVIDELHKQLKREEIITDEQKEEPTTTKKRRARRTK